MSDWIPSAADILESTNRINPYQLEYFRKTKLAEIDVLARKLQRLKELVDERIRSTEDDSAGRRVVV